MSIQNAAAAQLRSNGHVLFRLFAAAVIAIAVMGQAGCQGIASIGGAQPVHLSQPTSTPASVQRTFGLHVHDALTHWPNVPFQEWRLWDATVDWPRVEPVRGSFDFSRLDKYVKLAEQHNIKLIYVLGNTPAWAAVDPTAASNEGLPGASSPPANAQDWQDFVEAVVSRYKGRIQAYEVWNEANLSGYWRGGLDGMLQLTQIAYRTIKQADPAATVLAPSVEARSGMDWLSKFLAGGGADNTDAIAYHLYSTNPVPEQIVGYYQDVMAIGQQWNKPIWDTEVGWGPWGTFDEIESASFLARTVILQAAAGLTHINWYAWDDRGGWVHLYLVGPDMKTPTRAGIAFREIQSWLQGVAVACSSDSDGTWQCQLTAAKSQPKYIVWNPVAPVAFAIPAGWQVRQMRDLQGNLQEISGGQMQIDSMPLLLEP